MTHQQPCIRKRGIWAIVPLLVAGLITVSCGSPSVPGDVEDALQTYWSSLPSSPEVEHQIVNAWQGIPPALDDPASAAEMEIWCVETNLSAANDPALNGESLVWIVTRVNREAPWVATLLATMSSTWPYEACGRDP